MEQNRKDKVAVTKYDGSLGSVKNGIELVGGLEALKPSDSILIKPNIVWGGGGKIPKFGFITTSRIVEGIVAHLKEMGFGKISIGEGSTANDEVGSDTMKGFAWSGIKKATQKYGVKLIDFNKEPYDKVELGKQKVEIARAVMESDFLIDVPVLKTHAMTKVSLGMKNLKGCLSMKSKKKFHMLDLHEMIALLNTKIEPDLTVIDGIYSMERGPTAGGRAYRTDLILTSTDVFSCDVVGAMILGIDPASIDYIRRFSEIRERPLDPAAVEVLGEKLEEMKRPLQWKIDLEAVFQEAGIEGVTIQWPGYAFCTGCVVCAEFLLAIFCKDNAGTKLDPVEYCFGGESKAKEDSQKVILFGDCAIRNNKSIEATASVKGCPPKIADSMVAMINHSLDKKRARKVLTTRMVKGILHKIGLYHESFPRSFAYDPPQFDPAHF
ncbi:conserved hypothetical protein [delta proteobacterium NaphS2]|nr:conserved hypothetical protein [delta proteobacterium NaphS2]